MLRRDFLKRTALGSAAVGLASGWVQGQVPLDAPLWDHQGRAAEAVARDEAFWTLVRRDFAPAPDFTNLEYGYFCPAALPTLEAEIRFDREINSRASYFMRKDAGGELEATRQELAALAGVSRDEICITRNTTESMNIVIQGLDFAPGDEIIHSNQDYGSMVQAMKQKAKREGVVLKEVIVPIHPKNDAEVIDAYIGAITPRTKLIHLTHLINITGHILPVRAICDAAHARGVEVLVDSAHAFAHVDYKIPDLGCDYLGTSLHKWLCAPVGMGMLYVKREKIAKVWGLMGETTRADDDIRKLERLGTRPFNHHHGMRAAIRYHNALGAANKEARLRYLNTYWTTPLRHHERIYFNTPADPARHVAIANVGIRGVDPRALGDFLFDRYKILTAPIPDHPTAQGVRITPGLPTPLTHLDLLHEALTKAAQTL